jgi:tRNA (cytidine/uridine-2'-O-)-methyltransferase
MVKVVLYQPDIAQNVGAIIRTCVCFDVEIHIIEPCGFPFDLQRVKKAALDYINYANIIRHSSFEDFYQQEIIKNKARLILATTKADQDYSRFIFQQNDCLLFGKESSGVTDEIFAMADHKIKINMKNQMRSLNVAISCGIILSAAISKI